MLTGFSRALLAAAAICGVSCGAAHGSDDGHAATGKDLEAGQALIEKEEYAEAADVFAALSKESPDDASLHYYLGVAKANLDDTAAAEAEYKRAVELDATLLEARSNLGVLLLGKGDLEAAKFELEACISLDPEDGDSHYNLGLVLEAEGKTAEAAKEFTRAAEISPDDPLPPMALAEAERHKGKLDAALSWYDKAAARAPGDPSVSLGKAQVLLALKRNEEAATALISVGKMEAADATALTTAGMLLAKAGRDSDAIGLYKTAIAKEEKFPRAHILLANALARAKKFEEAAAEFETYLELAPDAEDADTARRGLEACRKETPKQP